MEIINISLIKPTTIHCETKYKMFLRQLLKCWRTLYLSTSWKLDWTK